MSLVTVEVEIEHGRVIVRGTDRLPDRASGLLTLLPEPNSAPERRAGSLSEFVHRWAGAFSEASVAGAGGDERLTYLVRKHLKYLFDVEVAPGG